jgi:hypothetical protein
MLHISQKTLENCMLQRGDCCTQPGKNLFGIEWCSEMSQGKNFLDRAQF